MHTKRQNQTDTGQINLLPNQRWGCTTVSVWTKMVTWERLTDKFHRNISSFQHPPPKTPPKTGQTKRIPTICAILAASCFHINIGSSGKRQAVNANDKRVCGGGGYENLFTIAHFSTITNTYNIILMTRPCLVSCLTFVWPRGC